MKKISIFIFALMLASACKKEGASPQKAGVFPGATSTFTQVPDTSSHVPGTPHQLAGTYTGVLEVKALLLNTQPPQTATLPVQIIFYGNNFQSGDPNIYSPVGTGSVQISTGSADFSNVDAFPGGDLFENAGLSGSYNYTIKGDSLILGKANSEVGYNYRLKKQ